MEPAQVKDLVGLLADRSSAWQSLWTVFYTVSAAIVALIASGKIAPKSRRLASFIASIGFVLFAGGNYRALAELREQRVVLVAFATAAARRSAEIVRLVEAAAPPTLGELRAYHWGLSLFVLVLLWAMPTMQKEEK